MEDVKNASAGHMTEPIEKILAPFQRFLREQANSGIFFLVSGVDNSHPVRHDRTWTAIIILLGMVTTATAGWLELFTAALVAAGLMIVTQCCSLSQARQSVDWSLLVVIAASLGLGLNLVFMVVAVAVTPWVWPFR